MRHSPVAEEFEEASDGRLESIEVVSLKIPLLYLPSSHHHHSQPETHILESLPEEEAIYDGAESEINVRY